MGGQPSKNEREGGTERLMENIHDCIVAEFCEEVETKAILNTTGTSSPLSSIALGNICLDQAAHLSLLIEPHLAMLARIDDAGNVWNGDSSFRNVGGLD